MNFEEGEVPVFRPVTGTRTREALLYVEAVLNKADGGLQHVLRRFDEAKPDYLKQRIENEREEVERAARTAGAARAKATEILRRLDLNEDVRALADLLGCDLEDPAS